MPEQKQKFLVYYNKYKNKIYTFFLYRLNFNKQQAEDMTSEVFIKVLKNFHSFDVNQSFQAWIYKISRNQLINFYKVSAREVPIDLAKNIETSDMLAKIDNKHELQKIIVIMDGLNKYYREVLILRFVDELTNIEIAEVLNKDERAVRTQISRALLVLRQKLKTKNYE